MSTYSAVACVPVYLTDEGKMHLETILGSIYPTGRVFNQCNTYLPVHQHAAVKPQILPAERGTCTQGAPWPCQPEAAASLCFSKMAGQVGQHTCRRLWQGADGCRAHHQRHTVEVMRTQHNPAPCNISCQLQNMAMVARCSADYALCLLCPGSNARMCLKSCMWERYWPARHHCRSTRMWTPRESFICSGSVSCC